MTLQDIDSHTLSVLNQLKHISMPDEEEQAKILRQYAVSRAEYGPWYSWASALTKTSSGVGLSPNRLRQIIEGIVSEKEILEKLIALEHPSDEDVANAIEKGQVVWAVRALRARNSER